MNPSRRRFIVGSAAAGGGLALGFNVPFLSSAAAQGASGGGAEINAWVVIQPDDTCVIRIARAEMGQGTHTGLAQLVAEELMCDWNKVVLEPVSPGGNLKRERVWKDMSTGGSRGIRGSQDYVRQGGAAARAMLVQAAANEWNVPVGELTVRNGAITHAASGRTTSYGKVAASAAKLTPPDPKSLKLKSPKEWTIAGKPMKRLDTAAKVNGSQQYSIDLRIPGMLNAAIKDCPVFGGKVASFDAAAIAQRPGVRGAHKVGETAVAVVADTWWHAKTALDALPIVWDEGPNAKESSATIAVRLKEGLTSSENVFADTDNGDALKAIAGAGKRLEAVYSTPFLSHSCMEPNNCTVRISADKAEVWMPSQNAEASMAALAAVSGLPLAKCEAHNHMLGGGFGRRGGTQDYVRQAAAIAKNYPDTPVKLIWTREEDQGHDFYRPISQCRMAAALDASGNLEALHLRVSGSRSTRGSRRRTSRTARTRARCRVGTRRPATRSSATPSPTCASNTPCATPTCRWVRGEA
jgi:isoquinoline 1-oxidoreductase beta subunit